MKILIGGSPCTHWSIAQTKNRETEASGIGWELFLNYRIARDKYQPDYFLYENNKSMSSAIRAQITAELGVEPVLINSALVSAQNRQRLYWVGRRNPDGTYSQVGVEQPADRGILLRDILETGVCWREKGYTLKPPANVKPLTEKETEYMVRETKDGRNHFDFGYFHDAAKDKSARVTANTHKGVPYNALAEPVYVKCVASGGRYIGEGGSVNQHFEARDGEKTNTITTVQKDNLVAIRTRPNGGGVDGPLYATPCCMRYERTEEAKKVRKQYEAHEVRHGFHELSELHPRTDRKSNTLSTVLKDNPICEQVLERDESGKWAVSCADGKKYPVYEVYGGLITVKGKKYPIRLKDGFYIIRKLTVTECKRLQTVPDEFVFPVSDSQAYKMLGNGWTVDVIAHIMSHFDGLTTEPVKVLSMYDGMSCGHIALDKLDVEIAAYYATEIDKYAIQTTQHNFPTTVQLGDAFQVRAEEWHLPETEVVPSE